jgi:hypothetical protein
VCCSRRPRHSPSPRRRRLCLHRPRREGGLSRPAYCPTTVILTHILLPNRLPCGSRACQVPV